MNEIERMERAAGELQTSHGVGAAVKPTKFNPKFVSQFDINVICNFYRSTYTSTSEAEFPLFEQIDKVEPANLPEGLKNNLAFFLFGHADAKGGYKNANKLLPVSNWIYKENLLVQGEQTYDILLTNLIAGAGKKTVQVIIGSVADGISNRGDIIQVYYFLEPRVGTIYEYYVWTAEIVIQCKNVSYATLLESTASDVFTINNIRYKVPVANNSQLQNQLKVTRQSIFGKLSTDEISPSSYQLTTNYLSNIVDIPLVKGIDKESSIGSYYDYTMPEMLLSIFVSKQNKITA